MKRKVADELTQRRSLEIAALLGNSSFDKVEKGPEIRRDMIQSIMTDYSKVIGALYGESIEEEGEPDPDDPFWQAMDRGIKSRQLPQPNAEGLIEDA